MEIHLTYLENPEKNICPLSVCPPPPPHSTGVHVSILFEKDTEEIRIELYFYMFSFLCYFFTRHVFIGAEKFLYFSNRRFIESANKSLNLYSQSIYIYLSFFVYKP